MSATRVIALHTVVVGFAALFLVASTTYAGEVAVSCGCYCGKTTPPPCSEEKCKKKCGYQGGSSGSQGSGSSAAEDAERQRVERKRQEEERQRRAEEARKREEAEASRRQEEFEKAKADALRSMKSITENELGLKGAGSTDDLGLKGAGASGAAHLGLKGIGATRPAMFVDSSVVDLRDLVDPNRPILVDPNIPKGRDRVFPVQVDPATLENAAYNQGFKHLALPGVKDALAAVEDFRQALQERPGDPMVHNALLLAQDILKGRQQAEQDNKTRAAHWTVQTYAALMSGETASALAFVTRAHDLNPGDVQIRALAALTGRIARQASLGETRETRAAYKLLGSSLVSLASDNLAAAAGMLEAARGLVPKDPLIADLVVLTGNIAAGKAAADRDGTPR